jgi:uncharacterized protein involved in cysteine biosynthesis
MIADIARGAQAMARALSLLNKPGVRIYVIVPLMINMRCYLAPWSGMDTASSTCWSNG